MKYTITDEEDTIEMPKSKYKSYRRDKLVEYFLITFGGAFFLSGAIYQYTINKWYALQPPLDILPALITGLIIGLLLTKKEKENPDVTK